MKLFTKKLSKKQNKATSTTDTSTEQTALYIDLGLHIAENKAAPLLLGNGWNLRGDDSLAKDRLLEIFEANGVDGLMKTSVMNVSRREEGNQLWITQPDTKGRIMINLANMAGSTIVGNQWGDIIVAKTVIDFYDGAFDYIINQQWGNGEMRTIVNVKGPTGWTDISVEAFNRATGFELLETWNYGTLKPLTMFKNKKSSGTTSYGDGMSVRYLQKALDNAFSTNERELGMNVTSILTKRSASEVKADQTVSTPAEAYVQVDNVDGKVQVMPGSFSNPYTPLMDWYIARYTEGCAYSTEADFNGTQTQVGVMFQGKADIETTKIKKDTFEKIMNKFIDNLIEMDSFINVDIYEGASFEFVLQSFNVLEVADEEARIDKMISLGIISKRDVIAHYYGIEDNEEEIDRILSTLDTEETMELSEEDNTEEEDNTKEED